MNSKQQPRKVLSALLNAYESEIGINNTRVRDIQSDGYAVFSFILSDVVISNLTASKAKGDHQPFIQGFLSSSVSFQSHLLYRSQYLIQPSMNWKLNFFSSETQRLK